MGERYDFVICYFIVAHGKGTELTVVSASSWVSEEQREEIMLSGVPVAMTVPADLGLEVTVASEGEVWQV
jgi:hypothetical protein